MILLVDDEDILVDLGRFALGRLGYTLKTTTDSREALELFRAQPEAFDLVIADLNMPGYTGLELARQLQAIRADIPIIIITGYSGQLTGAKIKELGLCDLLLKPFRMVELRDVVQRALGQTGTPREVAPPTGTANFYD